MADTAAGTDAGSAHVFTRRCLADPLGSQIVDAIRGAGADVGGAIESLLCDW